VRTVQRGAGRAKKVPELPDKCAVDALAKLPAEKQRSLAEAAETSEKIAIAAPSAHDPADPKMSNGTEKIGLAMQDFDRLATFKRRTLDSDLPNRRRQGKRSLAKVCEAARRAGADRVIVDGVVIALSPATAAAVESNGNEFDEWMAKHAH
jgi:hypothetical protein